MSTEPILHPPKPALDDADQFRVMCSGVFTAAYLSLVPALEALTKKKVVTLTTSIGTGENSIPRRLHRREPVDLLIVAEPNMQYFVDAGLIVEGSRTLLARSVTAVAVRKGEPAPDVSTVEAFRQTLLKAGSIAYSASGSGLYLTTQLYQRLGIADECLPKSRFVGNGERTGAVVARGDAELAFQQVSELQPVAGIDHITPIPAELQTYFWVATGTVPWARDLELSRAAVRLLASAEAETAIILSGLEPTRGGVFELPPCPPLPQDYFSTSKAA